MLTRRTILASPLVVASRPAWASTMARSALLKNYADAPGLVAVSLQGVSKDMAFHGAAATGWNGETVFAIASLSKVFTALLLADMVERGKVAMDDTVEKYLPQGVTIAPFEGKAVRLADLVTYTPGLPGWPKNLKPLDPVKPFPAYTQDDLYAALSQGALKYPPGTHYTYSNFGFGLLGHVLARRGGKSLDEMFLTCICTPLGMTSTRITLTQTMRARLAPGHDNKQQPVAAWEMPEMFCGAGGLFSTANDMSRFLEAATGRRQSALSRAFSTLPQLRRPADKPETMAAQGWFVSTRKGSELVWKDGATVGYSSFMGYAPQGGAGLILLTNGMCGNTLTPLGKHLLDTGYAFPEPQ